MYEYIKGSKVQLEEHMLSATEIASTIGVVTENNRPHGLLVSAIIRDYIYKNNLQTSEYYYVYDKGCMRVYPKEIWKKATSAFVFYNSILEKDVVRVLQIDSEQRVYKYKIVDNCPKKECVIVNIEERKNRKCKKFVHTASQNE